MIRNHAASTVPSEAEGLPARLVVVLRKGNAPGKKNEHGPTLPLQMPSWESRLSDSDIDALIAYMLKLEPHEVGDQQEQ